MNNIFLTSCMMFIVVACSIPAEGTQVILTETPVPNEDFVVYSDHKCVVISQKFFSQPGIYAEELTNHILENLSFSSSNTEIDLRNTSITFTTVLNSIRGTDGETIGSYGGGLNICLSGNQIEKISNNTVNITVEDLDGITHQYSWIIN